MKKTREIDVVLGLNIIRYRTETGKTRKELADSIGITHQQMQKYEKGINRVSVARLYDISSVLKVPVTRLLDINIDEQKGLAADNKSLADIMKYINKITDESKLAAIRNLVKSLVVAEATPNSW